MGTTGPNTNKIENLKSSTWCNGKVCILEMKFSYLFHEFPKGFAYVARLVSLTCARFQFSKRLLLTNFKNISGGIYFLRSLLLYPFLFHKVLAERMLWDIKGKKNY